MTDILYIRYPSHFPFSLPQGGKRLSAKGLRDTELIYIMFYFFLYKMLVIIKLLKC